MTDMNRPRQFDEQAAEEELERIRASLEEWRRRRTQASETFEAFVRSFEPLGPEPRSTDVRYGDRWTTPSQDVPPPAASPPRFPSAASASEGASAIAPAIIQARPAAVPAREEDAFESLVAEPTAADEYKSTESQTLSPLRAAWLQIIARLQSLPRTYLIAASGSLVFAIILIGWLATRGASQEPPADLPPVSPSASAPEPATPAAPAASPAGFQVELTTIRVVWLRVLVDGERTIEREVPPNQRITFTPKESVVIRAGDAGAVRVTVNGQETGAFGPDGFPNTRVFRRPQ